MRPFTLISAILLIAGCAIFNRQPQISKDEKQTFVELEEFGIRTKPILNREYLIFLSWYVDVFGATYPETVIKMLPCKTADIMDLSTDIEGFPDYPNTIFNPLFKNYILNPRFIDYPLMGLSKRQILEMQKWMTDRYNENLDIDLEHILFSVEDQNDENCYVIEAALTGQYEGTVEEYTNLTYYSKSSVDRWRAYPYKPNFRLPYPQENIEIGERLELGKHLREYSFGKEDFLWKWNEYYLDSDNSINKVRSWLNDFFHHYYHGNKYYTPFSFDFNPEYQPTEELMNNVTLEEDEQQFNNIAYLENGFWNDISYLEKDSIGRLRRRVNGNERRFVIVGADEENHPLVADRIEASNEPTSNAIYRIVYNKTIDSTYLPLKE